MQSFRSLKLAIENCLSDTNADFNQCDALVDGEVASYGVTQYAAANEDFSSIDLLPNTAAIKITGKTPLANCILTVSPGFDIGAATISWNYVMSSGGSLADTAQCMQFVKGSVAG